MISQPDGPLLLSSMQKKNGHFEPFNRIDNRSSGHASIGSRFIGKINIDCELLFKESKWGVIGDNKFPAGIIYLNLNFGPPQGCRVKSATITITLDEEATCLNAYGSGRRLHPSRCPVQMTECYGPRGLAGQNKTAEVKRTTKLTPDITVLGNGGGGVGFESGKTFTKSVRWSFNGQLLRGTGNTSWTYKALRWDLNENELESQSLHSTKVRTAFTFEHSGQPFLMKVDIDGKLEKWNDRLKSKLKFGTASEKEGKVVTLIDFEDYTKFQRSLDRLAEGLPRAMELQNLQEIPIEVPDSVLGTFFQPAQASFSVERPPRISDSIASPLQSGLPQANPPNLLPGIQSPSLQTPGAHSEAAARAMEFLRALQELDNPDLYRTLPEDAPLASSSATAVEVEEDGMGSVSETAEVAKLQDLQGHRTLLGRGLAEEKAIARVLELPLIIMLIRFLASIMERLGKGRPPKKEVKDAASIASVAK